jgi:hypothetical protein
VFPLVEIKRQALVLRIPIMWWARKADTEFLLQVELAQEGISQGEVGDLGDPTSARADKN